MMPNLIILLYYPAAFLILNFYENKFKTGMIIVVQLNTL